MYVAIDSIFNFLTQHYKLQMAFWVCIGCVICSLLSLYNPKFKGSIPFLRRFFPGKGDTFYFRCDTILLIIVGTILGMVLIQPTNTGSALFSGMTWYGTLSSMLKQKGNNE